MDDVDLLGSDVAKQSNSVSEKIAARTGASQFDELGSILVSIQTEAMKLDPASLQKPGVIGWIKTRFVSVKSQLSAKFESTKTMFDNLESQIAKHIAIHREWIKDLDTMMKENYEVFLKIVACQEKLQSWQDQVEYQLKNWPEISPDDPFAAMRMQEKQDVLAILKRIKIKKDYFLRLKTVVESRSPRISSQKETSYNSISTLSDIVDYVIPEIKDEFTLYLQSLDSRKSNEMTTSVKSLVNDSMKKGADAAQQAAIDSATAMNAPLFETGTMDHIRTKMLETVQKVKDINDQADRQREEDAKYLATSQQQYLTECNKLGLIK
jgi:uncharacterized protein YaaN involved in tellurite resistance